MIHNIISSVIEKRNNTKLHVITPLYRYQNVFAIYDSLKNYNDVIWHVGISYKNLGFPTINDEKVKVYVIECKDKEAWLKRREVLKQIKDGYFCFLDDDTVFHPGMHKKFSEVKMTGYTGMVVGTQIKHDGTIRLNPSIPIYTKIDAGNAFSHHSCLKEVSWSDKQAEPLRPNDFLFWESVYKFYGEKCMLTDEIVSVYNKLKFL